jgi:isocitrate dehydrogenase (NAD+)
MALMLSGAMMLRHLGENAAGDRLEAAVADVIAEGRDVTYDLRPARDDSMAATTNQVRDAVVARLAA